MPMRKIAVIVIVLVVVLAGGYTAYWHKKADDFTQMLQESITALNDQAKPFTKDTPLISYESLQASGYPFAMTIEVRKPVLKLPATPLLRAFFPQPGVVLPPVTPASDWMEEVNYGESVAFSGNITGDQFTFKTAGDLTRKTFVGGKQAVSMVSTSTSPLVCHLRVEQDGGPPWTMRPVFTDLRTFIAVFRAADCKSGGMEVKDAASGNLLFSADTVSAGMSNDAATGNDRKFAFTLDYKNAKASTTVDPIVAWYAQLVSVILSQPSPPMIPISTYGTINTKVDVRYVGPTDAKGMADPQAKMHFDINALDMSDAFATTTLEAHVATEPQGTDRVASVKLKGRTEVSELFDRLMPPQLTAMIAQMEQNGRTPQEKQLGEVLAKLGKPEDMVAAVLPKLHGFGKTALDIDFSVKGPNDKPNDFLTRGVYKLDALNWVAEPYGVKQSGSANLGLAGKPPTGELLINCLSCDALVTDSGNYALRIETLMGRLQQPPKPPGVTAELIEGVKQFLHGVSENSNDKNAKDLSIHIVMKPTGELMVSGKQIMEVVGLYAQTIAPHMSAFSPAAGSRLAPAAR